MKNKSRVIVSALRRIFLPLLALGVFASLAQAADGAGVITGRVSNKGTKEFLLGAVVRVEGSDQTVLTDNDGYFRIPAAAGARELTVSFTGLDTAKTTVNVSAGQTAVTDIELTSDIYRLTSFVVKGTLEGNAAAIQNQRQAMNTKTVAAVDTFGNPGGNVGELLQRLPGIAVDIGQGGEPGGIYVRGMTQDFSSLMVDGNQIAVSGGTTVSKGNVYFGNVTTSNVSSIEVIKAPLPDQDGNAVAGYINVRTKRAFESAPGRDIGLTVGTNWVLNHFDETVPGKDKPGIDLINLTYREVFSVFGGRNNLGVSANATFNNIHMTTGEFGISQVTNYNDAMFAYPAVGGNPIEPLQRAIFAGNLDANSIGSWTKTGGFNIDYKLNPDTVLYFKSTYQRINRSSGAVPAYFRWKLSVPKNKTSFDPTSTYNLVKTYGVGTVDVLAMNYIKETEMYSLASGLERRLWQGSGLLNVDANYSSNRTSYIIENINTQLPSGVGFQLSRRGHDFWTPELTQTAGPDWTNPANYIFRPDSSSNSPYEQDKYRAPAERWGYKIDLKKDFATKYPSYIKVGFKSDEFRQFAERGYTYKAYSGPALNAANGGITPYVGYRPITAMGTIGPVPFAQLPASGLPGDIFANPSYWTTSPADAYNGAYNSNQYNVSFYDIVNAGYAMGQVKIGNLRFLTGMRKEFTQNTGGAPVLVAATAALNNTYDATKSAAENAQRALSRIRGWRWATNKYSTNLPGAHLVYDDAQHGLQFRTSFNTSISRPVATTLLPTATVNDVSKTMTIGNPQLKPWTSKNYEATVAKYFDRSFGVGQVSATYFEKHISNYYTSIATPNASAAQFGVGDQYEGYAITQNRNIGSVTNKGWEFSYSQQYTFLPGYLSGLGSYVNLTMMKTSGNPDPAIAGRGGQPTHLASFTPFTYNGGITWRRNGLDIRVLANYRGRFFVSGLQANYGSTTGGTADTPWVDLYQRDRFLCDVKAEYTVNRSVSVYADAYNIFGSYTLEQVSNAYGREIPHYAQKYGTVFHAGVKLRL